mmetsp:Transcript_42973/g.118843  ORF Transcript_42973/g.118843 Transcript_42973/m.118843 type:complete len:242 (+) Transcript_42973:586-1311(+)
MLQRFKAKTPRMYKSSLSEKMFVTQGNNGAPGSSTLVSMRKVSITQQPLPTISHTYSVARIANFSLSLNSTSDWPRTCLRCRLRMRSEKATSDSIRTWPFGVVSSQCTLTGIVTACLALLKPGCSKPDARSSTSSGPAAGSDCGCGSAAFCASTCGRSAGLPASAGFAAADVSLAVVLLRFGFRKPPLPTNTCKSRSPQELAPAGHGSDAASTSGYCTSTAFSNGLSIAREASGGGGGSTP